MRKNFSNTSRADRSRGVLLVGLILTPLRRLTWSLWSVGCQLKYIAGALNGSVRNGDLCFPLAQLWADAALLDLTDLPGQSKHSLAFRRVILGNLCGRAPLIMCAFNEGHRSRVILSQRALIRDQQR